MPQALAAGLHHLHGGLLNNGIGPGSVCSLLEQHAMHSFQTCPVPQCRVRVRLSLQGRTPLHLLVEENCGNCASPSFLVHSENGRLAMRKQDDKVRDAYAFYHVYTCLS